MTTLISQVAVTQRSIQYVKHDAPLPQQAPMTAQLFGGIGAKRLIAVKRT
jgi:hypothetical protein